MPLCSGRAPHFKVLWSEVDLGRFRAILWLTVPEEGSSREARTQSHGSQPASSINRHVPLCHFPFFRPTGLSMTMFSIPVPTSAFSTPPDLPMTFMVRSTMVVLPVLFSRSTRRSKRLPDPRATATTTQPIPSVHELHTVISTVGVAQGTIWPTSCRSYVKNANPYLMQACSVQRRLCSSQRFPHMLKVLILDRRLYW